MQCQTERMSTMYKKNLLIFAILSYIWGISVADMVTGGISELQGDDFENAVNDLKTTLNEIKSINGPYYDVVTVEKASTQVVAGVIRRYDAVLKNDSGASNQCNVEIWSRPWLPMGKQVTISCTGKEEYEISYDAKGE